MLKIFHKSPEAGDRPGADCPSQATEETNLADVIILDFSLHTVRQ